MPPRLATGGRPFDPKGEKECERRNALRSEVDLGARTDEVHAILLVADVDRPRADVLDLVRERPAFDHGVGVLEVEAHIVLGDPYQAGEDAGLRAAAGRAR